VASSRHLEERSIALRHLFESSDIERLRAEEHALTTRVVATTDNGATRDGAGQTNAVLLAYAQALLALDRLHTSLLEVGVDMPMEFETADTIAELQLARLTPRELQVRDLVADGLSNAEVARHLQVSPNTVKTHVASLLRKLGASSRLDVIRQRGAA